jgi:flagellar motility protein MotE (MotC chaperone)
MNAPEFPLPRPRAPQPPVVSRVPVLRLLPLLIFVSIGMLGFRIEVVVKTLAHARNATLQFGQTTAFAQGTSEKPEDKSAAKPAAPEAKTDGHASDAALAEDGKDAKDGKDGKAAAGGEDGEATPPGTLNPQNLTKSEIETLQRLAERRDLIDKRERDLTAREGLLQAGESRIDGKIAELQELEKTIKGLLKQYDAQKQGEIESLVKIYGAMKPKDAASIFDSLDMPILVSVVQNMKESKVAPIMALMSREKARALTEELSQRKQIGAAGG